MTGGNEPPRFFGGFVSHGKDQAYVEERLRALSRDTTVAFGQLAVQVKADFTAIRVRLEALEQRLQQLEKMTVGAPTQVN